MLFMLIRLVKNKASSGAELQTVARVPIKHIFTDTLLGLGNHEKSWENVI